MNLIITANGIRHNAFAAQLSRIVPESLLIREIKSTPQEVIDVELRTFNDTNVSGLTQLNCTTVAEPQVTELICKCKPDFIFAFGCSLLSKDILDSAKCACVNIHTGLTQLYRGVDSSTWALYKKDFDNIGVTIHHMTSGIDDGDVIDQRLVSIKPNENSLEEVFIKTCDIGIKLLLHSTKSILNGADTPVPLNPKGCLYQVKDMTPFVKQEALENLRKYNDSRRLHSHN